jgi:hypothetical protein
LIVPLAVPLDPEVIVNHDESLTAVHGQPLGAVTAIDPVPPEFVFVEEVGL